MTSDRAAAVKRLLEEAERAHGAYESTTLNGVYDTDWPRWYAAYLDEHGLGELLRREVGIDELADQLATGFADFERIEPRPPGSWADYLARRLAGGT
jgi:hypothetical protein